MGEKSKTLLTSAEKKKKMEKAPLRTKTINNNGFFSFNFTHIKDVTSDAVTGNTSFALKPHSQQGVHK